MLEIYLKLFRYNASLKTEEDRALYFMHVADVNDLQLEIAKELVERDLL